MHDVEENRLLQKMLSIVVPVYQVEQYLEACVESLVQTDMDQVEIILVDDGSQDASGRICDELSERYECVRCIHQEHAGVSVARNSGLNAAKGKYIAFVDADDCLAKGCIPAVLLWAQNADADICLMQAVKFYQDGVRVDMGDGITRAGIYGQEKEAVFRYLASRPKYPGSACTKLFRREFLAAKRLSFPVERSYGEDFSFVMECLLTAERFDALDIPYYEYRQDRMDSASHEVTEKAFWQMSRFVSEFADRLTNCRKAVNGIARHAMSMIAYEYLVLLLYYELLRKRRSDGIAAVRMFLGEKQWVLDYAESRVGILGACCMKVLGFDLTARLIGILKEK